MRETIESIVIAFALAFLFRAFEAEAFVIPTGSMAPTLLGRHKDVECDVCGFDFAVSASDEVDSRSGQRLRRDVISATCPMCGRIRTGLDRSDNGTSSYSYNGDRIIAAKFFAGGVRPRRWDVVVFHYPEEADLNYIKRLIGLPGERLRIFRGDIYTAPLEGSEFRIARKPPAKVLATLQVVHDNDYLPSAVLEAGYPPRWQPLDESDTRAAEVSASRAADQTGQPSETGGWQPLGEEDDDDFALDAQGATWHWLVYRHVVPPPWQTRDELRRAAAQGPIRPQLITDAAAYNTERTSGTDPEPPPEALGLHWVGDLAVECRLNVRRASGEVQLRLYEAGQAMSCRIDLSSGRAELACEGVEGFRPQATTTITGPGSYRLRLANVDDQLLLWVDEELVTFDQPTSYEPTGRDRPTPDDLAPVRIAARDASLSVGGLRVLRDIYYITARGVLSYFQSQMISDFVREDDPLAFGHVTIDSVRELMATPQRWSVFERLEPRDFRIEADQYFFLGDNSARSKDSRLWGFGSPQPGPHHVVEGDLLIGKAIFVYWPHALPAPYHVRLPLVGREVPFPFYPNFRRMGFIR